MTPPLSGADIAVSAEPLTRSNSDLGGLLAGGGVVDIGRAGARPPGFYERAAKPVVDRLVSLTLLVVLAPLMAACAAAVAVSLGRPILLRQQRIGLHGEQFMIYKFRTMRPSRRTRRLDYVGPERRRTHKHPDDPRLTPLGRFLRTWSLDELPQLINVLRGEMSLVGPRPPLPYEVEQYDAGQMRRLDARPGITGLWQVSGRNQLSYRGMVRLDLEYIDRWTLLLDLGIMLRTIPVVLGNTGQAH